MKVIAHGKYDNKDLDRELRDIIIAIKELQTGSALTTVSNSTIISGGSGTSTSATVEIRKGIVAVTGGSTNTITFATSMPGTTYTLPQVRCWSTASGNYSDVGFTITNKTVYGFNITPIEDATCEYAAFY
jgi:hypothetical protein